ncbi:outer membrane protein [Legionella quinlivanii]|uniref:outer membrane protein n=1 Tax=Legionella quinlivanii TaxID=45073 RepID=UPI002243479F|nr:outer membrane beta-barrel protein [Legionella quinlivanii]MCW8451574.1 outer membrane beta-barrel protein [Legionella quinlivanii]
MKKLIVITANCMIAMNVAGVVYANDAQNPFSNHWTGLYAGANGGLVVNSVQLKSQQSGFIDLDERCNASPHFSSFFPGLQLGYIHQFANDFVTGIEADIRFNSHQNEALNCDCPFNSNISDRFTFKNQRQNFIKARVGRALSWNNNNLLPYVTAGASFAHLGLTYQNEGNDYYSTNTSHAGWLIGAGLEWGLGENWSLRAEYHHVDYGNPLRLQIPSVYGLFDPNGNARIDLSSNSVVLAINYWI